MSRVNSPYLLIKASAGSGKTFELSNRYINLLLDGADTDSILATTFTKKAAGEIQDRILTRLGEGAHSEKSAIKLLDELKIEDELKSKIENPQEKFRDLTVKVVRSLNRLRICTLDAFFMQLASGYAFELGLPPSWTIVEDVDNDAILSSAIRQTFAQTDGKSAYELAQLLFKGETPKSIEKQVFDLVKKATELFSESDEAAWSAIEKEIVPVDYDEDDCAAALENAEPPKHKTAVRTRDELVASLRDRNWDEIAKNGLFKKVAQGIYSYFRPIEGEFKVAVDQVKQLAANRLIRQLAKRSKNLWLVAASVARYFDEEKANEGAYRFDDLANKLAQFISRDQSASTVGDDADRPGSPRSTEYRLDSKTRALLLDEFQDASLKQWKIIQPFAEMIFNSPKDGSVAENAKPNFFCVGDVKQAIYGWRGGVAEIFDAIEKTFPGIDKETRNKNFRSCPTIIGAVNELFYGKRGENKQGALLKNRVFAELQMENSGDAQTNQATIDAVKQWSKGFEEHSPADKNMEVGGCWTLEVAPRYDSESADASFADLVASSLVDARTGKTIETLDGKTKEFLKEKLSVSIEDDADDDNESDDSSPSENKNQRNLTLAYAARRVWDLYRTYPKATIGVLMRSNDQLGEILRVLKKLGVEASDEGGAPLVDAPSVGAILALFRLAAHPADSVDAFCLASVKPFAERFEVMLGGNAVKLDPDRLDKETARRVSAALRNMIETKGFGKFVAEARDLVKPVCDDRRQEERLDQFVDFAYGFQTTSPNASLDAFVKAVESYKTQAPDDAKVRVMTIHGSKGLEFDIVVLPELDSPRGLADISREKFIVGRKQPEKSEQSEESPRRSSPLDPIEAVINYVSKKEFPLLPPKIRRYFQDASYQAVKEALCLLYVAVTRPRRALLAIVPPEKQSDSSKSSAPKLTFANILRYGLNGVEPNGDFASNPQILYQRGNLGWGDDLKNVKTNKNEEQSPKGVRELGPPIIRKKTDQKRLLYQRKTPTGSPEDFSEDAAALARKGVSPKNRVLFDWRNPKRYARGLCIHACYEQIEWLETSQTTPDVNRLLPLAEFDREIVDGAIRDFNEELSSPFAAALLSRRAYEEPDAYGAELFRDVPCAVANASRLAAPRFVVFRERPYQFSDNGVLWNGVIDRLVLLYDGAELVGADVVDFKSDERIVPERLEEYRLQLKRYGEAVNRLYGLPHEKISLRVAFVTLRRLVDARTGAEAVFDRSL